ncbi:MAG: sugar transferase [Naasia sp.]|nr:sugar transferase [Naasia sp.]
MTDGVWAGASPRLEVAPPPARTWARGYAHRLLFTDVIVVLLAVGGSHLFWFGVALRRLERINGQPPNSANYWLMSVLIIVGWLALLALYETRGPRIVGIGALEYKRIFDATLTLFGVVAIIAVVFTVVGARGFIITAFPLGLFLLIFSRWGWRQWLVRKRLAGELMTATLVVGSRSSVEHLIEQLRRHPAAGYRPVGVVLPRSRPGGPVSGLPVLGSVDDVARITAEHDIGIVILTSSDHLPARTVREISWSLEPNRVELVMAPAITETAGPRIHTRPVAGLPLLHVEFPRFEGGKRAAKAVFDWLTAAVLTVLALPVFLVLALIVALDSRGPVFFRQQRVGLNGQSFRMFKFRSMVANAEDLRAGLEEHNESDGPLFKLRQDPRITRSGRWMRRFSLDELPQLINVLRGEMAIVGPRPPLVEEAARYEPDVRRRLLVKPGITGPWQIYGRSDLSWEEGVRLDLYYVENWSIAGDLILLMRTVGAVLRGHGAY